MTRYLLNPWTATGYNGLAGLLLVQTYTLWSHGFPWNRADASGLPRSRELTITVIWMELLLTVILSILRIRSITPDPGVVSPAVPLGAAPTATAREEPEPWRQTRGNGSGSASSSSHTTPNPR